METEKETEKVTEAEDYKLVTIPTGEAIAIQTPSGEVITTEQAIVEVLNIAKRIEKSVA